MDRTTAYKVLMAKQKENALKAISPERGADGFIAFMGLVKTKDEKDGGKVKYLPSTQYLKALACHFVQEPLLLVPKSRQMLVSWLAVSYAVWHCSTSSNRLCLWQSKNEDDAAKMVYTKDDPEVARASFVSWHMPEWLFPRPRGSYGHLLWPNKSQMRAIQQGPHVIRSESPSLIISDEMAFQEDAGDAYTAAKPAIDGGGQFIGISSANPGFFWDLVEDKTTSMAA